MWYAPRARGPSRRIRHSGSNSLSEYSEVWEWRSNIQLIMQQGILQKRREKHLVEISRKRHARIFSKNRSQHGYVDSQTSQFLDQTMELVEQKNFFALEVLTKEFLLANSEPNLSVLLTRLLQEESEARILLVLTLLNYLYGQCQFMEASEPGLIITKCLGLHSQPVLEEGFKFIATLLFVDKAACVAVLESGLFLKVADAVDVPYLRPLVLTIFQNFSYNLGLLLNMGDYDKLLTQLLHTLTKLFKSTNSPDYLVVMKEVLGDADCEESVIMLVEKHMGDAHELFTILEKPNSSSKEAVLAAAEVLELMFYCDDNVVATLLAADFGGFVTSMLESSQDQVKTCGLNCLESILIAEDVSEFVVGHNYVPILMRIYESTICQAQIQCPAVDNATLKCINSLANSESLQVKVPWETFLANCLNRLDHELLQFQTLSLLRTICHETGPSIWPTLERLGLMMKLYEIAKIGTQEYCRNQADALLELQPYTEND